MIDLHVHVEEGPYSTGWLGRMAEALSFFGSGQTGRDNREWLGAVVQLLQERLSKGAYSREWLDLYRTRARQIGITEVGVVEHLYRFREFAPYYEDYLHLADDRLGQVQRRWLSQVSVSSLDEYVAFVQGEKQRWADNGVKLKLGIELDYFPGGEADLKEVISRYPWDYVIGSVHFLRGWGFAHPDTVERFRDIDLLALYARLFDMVEQAVSSRLFDLVGHLDNLKLYGHRPSETALLPYYQRIAKLLKHYDLASEINSGLYRRQPIREMSPSFRFLEVLAQHGVPLTLASGCQFPDQLGRDLPEAKQLLKKAGYRSIVTFEGRKRSELPLI